MPVWTYSSPFRQVTIETIPRLRIAYTRQVGPYQGDVSLFDTLYEDLFQWAVPRGLVTDTTYSLNVYHDPIGITDQNRLRVMVAIPVEEDTTPSGPVGVTRISGGRYGVCRFLLRQTEFREAWHWMFSVWLAQSGYERDDREAFERCFGERRINGERRFDADICIPVRARH